MRVLYTVPRGARIRVDVRSGDVARRSLYCYMDVINYEEEEIIKMLFTILEHIPLF